MESEKGPDMANAEFHSSEKPMFRESSTDETMQMPDSMKGAVQRLLQKVNPMLSEAWTNRATQIYHDEFMMAISGAESATGYSVDELPPEAVDAIAYEAFTRLQSELTNQNSPEDTNIIIPNH